MHKKYIKLFLLTIIIIAAGLFVLNSSGYEKLHMLNALGNSGLEAGERVMGKRRVVIAGITRDDAKQLPGVIKHIEYTGSYFQDYRVVIFENDSKDGTKKILGRWQERNPKVKIITQDFGFSKRPSISFMAQARNYYMDEIETNKEYQGFDILMVVDMDMHHGWDIRGVMNSFNKYDAWEAVCSNGVTREGKMYDMFAFRNKDFPHNSSYPGYWSNIVPSGHKIYEVGRAMIPVYSCFGGMAFYKMDAIKGCRYKSMEGDCEHVMFHKCLRGRMYMNPSQVLRYPLTLEKNFVNKLYHKIMSIIYP